MFEILTIKIIFLSPYTKVGALRFFFFNCTSRMFVLLHCRVENSVVVKETVGLDAVEDLSRGPERL